MSLFLLSLLPFFIFVLFKIKKAIHMLQQNYYDESGRYFLWILKNPKKVWLDADIFFPFLALLWFLDGNIRMLIFAFFSTILVVDAHNKKMNEQVKKPLVITARVKRLMITIFLLYGCLIVPMCIWYDSHSLPLYYLILSGFTYFGYLVVKIANHINYPVEKIVFYHYRRKAIKKLKEMNIPVIGITGSYGKTSSKNIVNEILSVKYNTFMTPKNFNTTYGMINSINNYLDKFEDYFIAEMGAFKRGEIARTCKLMKPTYGIITSIGKAHLESFGSQENIQKGKFELVESLPKDGVAILNKDDVLERNYAIKNTCNIYWIGIDEEDVDIKATNIQLSKDGCKFDVKIKGEDTLYAFQTRLLGRHNIYNILFGIALAYHLGMSLEEIQRGVSHIKPIEHRLELKLVGNLNIIDDAYNSNPVGARAAIDALKMMPGEKIVVTPGMIELGDKQYEENKAFGSYMAEDIDYVILIGKEQTQPIYDGLMENHFDSERLFVLNDVKEAFPLIQKLKQGEVYVLLENDLPDLFNE